MMDELTILLVPVITGAIEVVKKFGKVDKKFGAGIATFLGALLGFLFGTSKGDPITGLLDGIKIGLASAGFYSLMRSPKKK